ncbi:response regulator [Planctomycetota bacterium]
MSHKVLFVDDEPKVTKGLKHALYEEDFEILTANSGPEALKILSREPVDVVVSDEKMPGMTGTLLLSVIKRDYPDTVRIMLTGQASLEVAVRAINNGEIYRFLMKPCNGTDLAITIRQALQQRKLLVECRKLLKMTRQKTEYIKQLEASHPGIMEVKRDATGTIIIDDPAEDVDELIQEINTEVKNSEEIFMDWTVPGKA